MSEDRKCDRCGQRWLTPISAVLPILPSMEYRRSRSLCRASLCPDCMTDLSDWWFLGAGCMSRYFVTRPRITSGEVVTYLDDRGRSVTLCEEMDGPSLADVIEVARAHEKALSRYAKDRP